MNVFIETYGCQMNAYDSSAITGFLDDAGHLIISSSEDADVILINTCSVRDHAEHKILSRIGNLRAQRRRAQKPQQIIGICGCMAERMVDQFFDVSQKPDLVIGVDKYSKLPELLSELQEKSGQQAVETGHRDDVHYVAPPEAYPVNNSHLVTIHKGCDYKCTYCIVPMTRGPQREKSPLMILDEIKHIIDKGGKEVTLLGQNVTAYNAPGTPFSKLLQQISRLEGLQRIRFLTSHPCDIDDDLIDTIASVDKICPWLHIPAQSGSDSVLKRMKRYYNSSEYLSIVDKARDKIDDVTFSGDFIVGFPGETEQDFQDTVDLMKTVRYDSAFCFKYSERPGTPACKLKDDVAIDVKKARLAELLDVQESVWEDIANKSIGQRWQAVVEDKSRDSDAILKARTANNRKILVSGTESQTGDLIEVEVTGFKGTSFTAKAVC